MNATALFYVSRTDHPLKGKSDFSDAEYWDELASKHLAQYDLPAWDVEATHEALAVWIGRMGLTNTEFLKMGNYVELREAVTFNPTWPLRALIGLALETREAR